MWASYSSSSVDNIEYSDLRREADALFSGEHWLTNLANAAALLKLRLPEVNWVGFYLAGDRELILGPFQGNPACVRIPFGKGVCGTSAAQGRTILIDDIERFRGHIACDADSRAELVIPLVQGERLLGVLDLDSPKIGRFSEADRRGLESFASILLRRTEWPASLIS